MAGSLEYLLQDVLCDPVVETSDIKCSFVWLRSGPTHKSTSAGGGHHAPRHRRSDRRRNRVGILRDHHWRTRRRRHVRGIGLAIALGCIVLLVLLLLLLARSASRTLRRQSGGGSGHVFSHCDTVEDKQICKQRINSRPRGKKKPKLERASEALDGRRDKRWTIGRRARR